VVFLFFRAGILLVLAATIVVAPIVLIASFSVQAYVLLSWLEGRSLAKLQEHHRLVTAGQSANGSCGAIASTWALPQVPWIPALVFFLVPAAMLAQVAAPLAAGLAVFQIVAAIFYARRDPVHGIDHSPARGGVEAPKSFAAALCGRCGLPSRQATWTSPPRGTIGHRKLDPAPSFFRAIRLPLPSFPG